MSKSESTILCRNKPAEQKHWELGIQWEVTWSCTFPCAVSRPIKLVTGLQMAQSHLQFVCRHSLVYQGLIPTHYLFWLKSVINQNIGEDICLKCGSIPWNNFVTTNTSSESAQRKSCCYHWHSYIAGKPQEDFHQDQLWSTSSSTHPSHFLHPSVTSTLWYITISVSPARSGNCT